MAARGFAKSSKDGISTIPKTNTKGGAFKSFSRPKTGKQKQKFDPASGRKVFAKEFKSGRQMARAAGIKPGILPGTPQSKALGQYRMRLNALDSGKEIGKPGERSFLRGIMAQASGGGGGQ